MAETTSLIIACVFICSLFASNTLICTAEVHFECNLYTPTGALGGEIIIQTVKPVIVGGCYSSEACETLCSRLGSRARTEERKSGKCAPDDDKPGQEMACACCLI
ncbi:hypothetical protein MKW98_006126 [Papaver atlanticum]|uniref:Uncharacterized protein n=1 Tax=Papaver atlanticum TaxID=357466 RepID=A0AAD4TH09_9MAGN|nr:hypothetical protein MKW98_006126 [Papaver atlanticum]